MNQQSADDAESALRGAILHSNQDPIPRSIVLRVCLVEPAPDAYLRRLYREIELLSALLARDRQILQLQFDGADPALLQPALRAELSQSLAQHFSLSAGVASAATQREHAQRAAPQEHCDRLGLGLGSVSCFGDVVTRNAADLGTYFAALDAGHLPVIAAEWVSRTA
jgi:coproporphyrinogen III oxidase-like Fe-S oxidoreductase